MRDRPVVIADAQRTIERARTIFENPRRPKLDDLHPPIVTALMVAHDELAEHMRESRNDQSVVAELQALFNEIDSYHSHHKRMKRP